jgi:hypothetical protein
MRQNVGYDLRSALDSEGALEDEVYFQMDKLLALCTAQTALDHSDQELPVGVRSHYSLLMEEQARTLRDALEKLLG